MGFAHPGSGAQPSSGNVYPSVFLEGETDVSDLGAHPPPRSQGFVGLLLASPCQMLLLLAISIYTTRGTPWAGEHDKKWGKGMGKRVSPKAAVKTNKETDTHKKEVFNYFNKNFT